MPPSNTHSPAMEDQIEDTSDMNFLEIGGFVSKNQPVKEEATPEESRKQKIIWVNVVLITLFHVLAVYMGVAYVTEIKLMSIVWGEFTSHYFKFNLHFPSTLHL